jgi:lysyl-tRNA synthetase class II
VAVAGRIYNKRVKSKKLAFLDLHGDGCKLQIILEFGYVWFNMLLTV